MNLSFDTVIAGCGLAGACAAFELSASQRVLIIDRTGPGAGASGTTIGLVSPLMARRARPVWRMAEAVAALNRMIRESNSESLFRREGVLKPARSSEQADEFRDAASRWPAHGVWHDVDTVRVRWPEITPAFGLLEVTSGGSISMPALCANLLKAAVARGAKFMAEARITDWTEGAENVRVSIEAGSSIRFEPDAAPSARRTHSRVEPDPSLEINAKRLLLAIGSGYLDFPELSALHLHPIKGQWIRLEAAALNREAFRPVSSRRYIASLHDHFIVGSTYEHNFEHLRPTEQASSLLHAEATELINRLATARIVGASAAVRVTVPGIRLPMVGPLPGRDRVWIFTGLGSKGLLMAPLLAGELPEFFTNNRDIPKEIRVS